MFATEEAAQMALNDPNRRPGFSEVRPVFDACPRCGDAAVWNRYESACYADDCSGPRQSDEPDGWAVFTWEATS